MIRHILPLIPKHSGYIEPFCGGAAVFFAKQLAKNNILNDINGDVVNFYKVLKDPSLREEFLTKVESTLYSKEQYVEAKTALFVDKTKDKIIRAWALFTIVHQSFNRTLFPHSTWSRNVRVGKNNAYKWHKKCVLIKSQEIIDKLHGVQIDSREALNVISLAKNEPDTFVYIDPPYVGADQGHYSGYTEEDFERLLQCLEELQGQWMLSSFPSERLQTYTDKNGWYTEKVIVHRGINIRSTYETKKDIEKTEVLTMNYKAAQQTNFLHKQAREGVL